MGASYARLDGVTSDTHKKKSTQFSNWLQFLDECELDSNPYLDGYTRINRQKILGAFMQTVREQTYSSSTKGYDYLVAKSCRSALEGVREAFRISGRPDPSLDPDGKTSFILQRQLRGYANNDPSACQQKPIPIILIKQMITRQCSDPGLKAFHELIHLAFFFAMRSCEYLEVKGERRSDPIRLRNLVFRKGNRIVPHDHPLLANADTVTVTFEFQKKDLRDDPVTQSRTSDAFLCPVRAAATIVRRLQSLGADKDTHIYVYKDTNGTLMNLNSKTALIHLRNFITTVDENWGLKAKEVGLHSIRSSAAMAMYLNQIPVYTIMLLGRWSSDAFLLYIRKQVTEFSNKVSDMMIQNPAFHHIQAPSREDPRNHNSMAASANMGMGAGGATINRNAFSLWV